MQNPPAAIKISGLKKNYGSVRALRGVDLEVSQGEVFGFLGPNGAGKTTTIRCMLGLIRPNAGSIEILGQDARAQSLDVRRKIGYLPGELTLESNMSVEGQLRYFSDLRGGKTDWDYTRKLADRLQLNFKTPIKNLSKGNKQKVGVVQALMSRPQALLLDEPTTGLDPLMQQEVYHILQEAREFCAAIFFSSHIISEVEAIASRVGIIRKGKIVQTIRPDQLVNMSIRRVSVRFKDGAPVPALESVPGVSDLSHNGENKITLHVEGDMDPLIKALAVGAVADLSVAQVSLEEVFLQLYKSEEKEQAS
jgi:ABC-2 type transport system ATP-binding protein